MAAYKSASKLRGIAWVAAASGLAAVLAGGIRPLALAVPWSWETKFGKLLSSTESAQRCAPDAAAQAAQRKLIDRIFPLEPGDTKVGVRVEFIRNAQINAFATPGGRIIVYSALLRNTTTPEELTGVLAHEIEHIARRHVIESLISRLFGEAGLRYVISGDAGELTKVMLEIDFSRAQEIEADTYAYRRMRDAHVDNRGLQSFFSRLEKEESEFTFIPAILEDHPRTRERIEIARQYPNEQTRPVLTEQEWRALRSACKRLVSDN